MKRLFFSFLSILLTISGFAQSSANDNVEMADKFRADGKIYVVIIVAGIILIGIFTYLILLDKKIGKLEKEINS